jgi:hypothetical protein
MSRSSSKVILLALGMVALLVNLSCTSDDIPVTPEGPFLYSQMLLTSMTTPTPYSTLTRGQQYTTRFSVAYTLNPSVSALLKNRTLALYTFAYSENTDTSYTYLSGLRVDTLSAVSAIIADSIVFTVPNNALYLTVLAGIDTLPLVGADYMYDYQEWYAK